MTLPRYRLGVDVGGTHTDLVLLDTATGALAGRESRPARRRIPRSACSTAWHGSSPRRGAGRNRILRAWHHDHHQCAAGDARRQGRPADHRGLSRRAGDAEPGARRQPVRLFLFQAAPIAPQSLTREIPERSDYTGTVLVPLDHDAVRRSRARAEGRGRRFDRGLLPLLVHESGHEQATRAIILEEFPGVHVSLSSEVLPRIREWPRMSTTLLNAYLEPVLVHYIRHLNRGLDDAGVSTQQRFLMQSNGGVMPFSAAIAGGRTVHTLFSGPAAGAQASALSRQGGGAQRASSRSTWAAPRPISPSSRAACRWKHRRHHRAPPGRSARARHDLDLGGRRLDRLDRRAAGFLNVGPQSAGADPGPACYGRGGTQPTVTDADLVCGYLNPDYFLGGAQTLDVAPSRAALRSAHRRAA